MSHLLLLLLLLLLAGAALIAKFWHNVQAYRANQLLEQRYAATLLERSRAVMREFDPNATFACEPACEIDASLYSRVDRVSNLSHSDFLRRYLFQGKPVIVTDVGREWPITSMHLADLARLMPEWPLVPRAVHKGRGLGVRGLRLWERYAATTLERLVADRDANVSDSFYYSWLNVDRNTSLLERGLYAHPYFLNASDPFIAEWMYVGQTGTGVLPHIDHMCMAKWSFQIRGRKMWHLRPSVAAMTHLGDMDVVLSEGEFLFFLPDHEHGTMCLPPEGRKDGVEECLSLHGYLAIPFADNCYLQKLLRIGHAQHAAALLSSRRSPSAAASSEGFVRYAPPGRTRHDAPRDYFSQCPPTYRQRIAACNVAEGSNLNSAATSKPGNDEL
jgi:hypothetical protein